MRRRSIPGRAGLWRHRFVQIAREIDARAKASSPAAGVALRSRPGPGAPSRARTLRALLAAA